MTDWRLHMYMYVQQLVFSLYQLLRLCLPVPRSETTLHQAIEVIRSLQVQQPELTRPLQEVLTSLLSRDKMALTKTEGG